MVRMVDKVDTAVMLFFLCPEAVNSEKIGVLGIYLSEGFMGKFC